MNRRPTRIVGLLAVAAIAGACATAPPAASTTAPGAPRFAEYPAPIIPAAITVADALRARHTSAWNTLQAGDVRGAAREFNAVLKLAPDLYPAEAGLGFTYLANRQYADALPRFVAALTADDQYVPAWVGQADALLGLERDAEAIASMERVLQLDPQRDLIRTRLELVRFRLSQSLIEAGRRARATGRDQDAVRQFEQALALSPESTMILRELAQAHVAAGRLDDAERYARRVVQIEPGEGEWQALLGDVLEAAGRYADAAEAYERASKLEPNPDWDVRARQLRERAEVAALPPAFATVATAPVITRADVAAYIGIHLRALIEGAPARGASVATDVRDHWAEPWILAVTRAGVMAPFANHTFQPAAPVRRGDLAAVVAELVRLADAAGARGDLAAWQAARPQFADLSAANVFYEPASLAVAAGAMSADAAGRFAPTADATGADLDAAVRRVAALAGS